MRRIHLVPLLGLLFGSTVLPQAPPRDVSGGYQVVHGWPQLPEGFALR